MKGSVTMKRATAELLPPAQELPSNVRLLNALRSDGAGSYQSDLLRNAGIALGRNSKFFRMLHSEKLTDLQKIQDKIDEYLDEDKRNAKVLKLMEKLQLLRTDLDIFEGMFTSTDAVKKELEGYCQLEFDFPDDGEAHDE